MKFLEDNQYLVREDYNVPIFQLPYSTVGGDLIGLCQPDQRGKLRLIVIPGGLEELYYSLRSPIIIFHHRYHSCTVIF
jgi:hypothetical protein